MASDAQDSSARIRRPRDRAFGPRAPRVPAGVGRDLLVGGVVNNGLAHLFGDYVVQSDHMARNKVKTEAAPDGAAEAAAHAVTYAACYLPLTRDPRALAVIGGTHYVIDRWRLAKRLVWARNQLAPASSRYAWEDAGAFGEAEGTPPWLAGWLLFIADNACHLAINEWALRRWR